MFSSSKPETESHLPDPSAVAPNSSSIVANAEFPSGQSTATTTKYSPTPGEKVVTSPPGPTTGVTPVPLPPSQLNATSVPPPRTAPTVFITSTTATAEPAAFPLITVGPIIGLVTESTARVLIECNTTMTVQVRLTLIDRHCRLTKANRGKHGDPSLHNVDGTTKGAVTPTPHTNGSSLPPLLTQPEMIMTGASSGSPVAGAPASHLSPAMRTQEAAIMTGASSGSPVNGAPASIRSSPTADSASSTHTRHPSQGSPGTTIGRHDATSQVGAVSSESSPAPATNPSPTEHQQHPSTASPHTGTQDAGTFAPSAIADEVRDGVDSAAYHRDTSTSTPPTSLMSPVADGPTLDKDVDCTAHRVSTVTFTGLESDARYELTFLNVKSRVTSTITTLIDGWKVSPHLPLNLGIVSCNMVAVTRDLEVPESDLWIDLRRRVAAHELDYVLHIGDQIYADEKRDRNNGKEYQLVFKSGVEMIEDLPTSDWPACAVHIKELYRQLYRETWTHPPTAFVLANCPSLMIYDDHDFRDDWGNGQRALR